MIHTLTCEWCGARFRRRVHSRNSGRFCTRQCSGARLKAETAARRLPTFYSCPDCGQYRLPQNRYCATCMVRRKYRHCLHCEGLIVGSQKFTCSRRCRYERLKTQLLGKQYRPSPQYERTCSQCGHKFVARRTAQVTCHACVRRLWKRRRGGDHYRHRCKRAGVPYSPAVTQLKVFRRDKWRCQLCGRATPRSFRGTNKPNAPQLDHIIPLNAPNGSPGHVWENVQCACRACNMRKGAKPLGQLRLAV
jgi:HNH endonuclease